ncbi:hypothetical protein [Spiroplasma culicicola]|uniref:Uncharacterized protein n=1 Tax=Spiroplasma culicicola AES-1 TaxID=1276246 RepID=W6A744_9MOLU|nr:hypothetical protein [Spiroplasma culicicola]AHI52791.1 hypothetical protein SCULI_v1c04500 [Spiroplasma culicicola AES-1]
MYYEKTCCVCNEQIDPREAWSIIKIKWLLPRREIHHNVYVQLKCIVNDLDTEDFRMSHPLFDITMFVRTKWKGEFETTLNINYNQPIYVEGKNLNEKVDHHEVDPTLNNHKIQLNFFMYFAKLTNFKEWYRNMLYFMMPILNKMLKLKEGKKAIESKFKKITKYFDFDHVYENVTGLKRIKYNYSVFERLNDEEFQKCYTNKEVDCFTFKLSSIEAIYTKVARKVTDDYKTIVAPYLEARKNAKFKPTRVRAFEM